MDYIARKTCKSFQIPEVEVNIKVPAMNIMLEGNVGKCINPIGENGERLICPFCGSYQHLLKDCPDSYENMKKKSEQNWIAGKEEEVLFANLGLLGLEASNKGIIDSGCSSTVCGKEWLDTYLDTLNEDEKSSVVWKGSEKWFKFGGGELLKSLTVSSAAGYIIFVVGDGLKCIPLCWKSNKIQRKINSTLAAETLALREAVDHAILLRNLLKSMLCTKLDFPAESWTDNKNAFLCIVLLK